jgi:hypothetical protein
VYPYQHLWIDRDAFESCRDRLAAAGLPFTEENRTSFIWIKGELPITDVFGHLHTPNGRVECVLRDTMGKQFDVKIPIDQIDLYDMLKQVFAGHVLERPGKGG